MNDHTTHTASDPDPDPNDDNKFLSLPTEVRHKIYGYLFCKDPGPIWLVSHYQLFQPLYAIPASRSDPIFETQLFRCCKKSYRDAAAFAYMFNRFEVRGDLTAFYSLGQLALTSLRSLSIVQGPWKSGAQEDKTWALIQQHCSGLEHLELVLQQDTLLASIPFLDTLQDGQTQEQQNPSLALDIYIWDRHFSFDPLYRDLAWSKGVIRNSIENAGANSMARRRVLSLPRRARHIVLTADLTAGAVQALDAYIASLDKKTFTKSTKAPPHHGPRAVGGRSTRFWYER